MRTIQLSAILLVLGYWLLLMESAIISFPFVFIFCIAVLSVFRNLKSILFAFILSLFADSFRVINFGATPVFIFATFMAILLYERYFGKNDVIAIILIIILATLIYAYYMSFSFFNIFLVLSLLLIFWITTIIFRYSLEKRRR